MLRRVVMIAIVTSNLFAKSEQEIIIQALDHSYSIKTSRTHVTQDSIRLQEALDYRIPSIKLSLDGKLFPFDSSSGKHYAEYSYSSLNGSTGIGLSQPFASGGRIDGKFSTKGARSLDSDSTWATSDIMLSITQPLLRDAWGNSYFNQRVKRETISYAIDQQRNKKMVINALSKIRNDLIEYSIIAQNMELLLERKGFAKKRHTECVAQFNASNSVVEDTLSTFLSLMSITKTEIYLKNSFATIQDRIEFLTGEEVSGDIDFLEIHPQFPQRDTLLYYARQNPDFSMLTLIDSNLSNSIQFRENDLLPDIRATAKYHRSGRDEHLFEDDHRYRSFVTLGLSGNFTFPLHRIRHDIHRMQVEQERRAIEREEDNESLDFEISRLERLWNREHALLEVMRGEQIAAQHYFELVKNRMTASSGDRVEYDEVEQRWYETSLAVINQELVIHNIAVVLDRITGDVLQRYNIEYTEDSNDWAVSR